MNKQQKGWLFIMYFLLPYIIIESQRTEMIEQTHNSEYPAEIPVKRNQEYTVADFSSGLKWKVKITSS